MNEELLNQDAGTQSQKENRDSILQKIKERKPDLWNTLSVEYYYDYQIIRYDKARGSYIDTDVDEDHAPQPQGSLQKKFAGLTPRDQHWSALKEEQQIIKDYYEQEKIPVPQATQLRMDKSIAAFRETWDGIPPDLLSRQSATLNEEELKQELPAWRNLMTSQKIVDYYYDVQGFAVPDATEKRQAEERDEFCQEVDAYKVRMKTDQIRAPDSAITPVEDKTGFKKKLDAIRQQTMGGIRPKGSI